MGRHLRLAVGSVGLLFALGWVVLGGGPASAQPADVIQITSCGQAIDANAILAKNLVCAGGDGVIITAGDVTLGLNGHTIRSSTGGGRGIVVDGPLGSTVTMHGPGTIKAFDAGIDATRHQPDEPLSGSYRHHVIVVGLRLLDNARAIALRTRPHRGHRRDDSRDRWDRNPLSTSRL